RRRRGRGRCRPRRGHGALRRRGGRARDPRRRPCRRRRPRPGRRARARRPLWRRPRVRPRPGRRARRARATATRSHGVTLKLPSWLRGPAADRALAVVFFIAGSFEVILQNDRKGSVAANVLAVAALTVPLAWRRRYPFAVLMLTVVDASLQAFLL